jgi:hypothetical protein
MDELRRLRSGSIDPAPGSVSAGPYLDGQDLFMRRRRRNSAGANPLGLAWNAGMLALEAQQVVGLRMAKLLMGGGAVLDARSSGTIAERSR